MSDLHFSGFIRRPGNEGLATFKVTTDGQAFVNDEDAGTKENVAAAYPGQFYETLAQSETDQSLTIDQVFPV